MSKSLFSLLVDRRLSMFGRAPDIQNLIAKAKGKGLTIVYGRPKMGKTWLLTQVAWQLSESDYLVGYQESKGEAMDSMLLVVADLYARWLSDASKWKQAKSIWERHKENLITSTAKAVSKLFSPLAKPLGLDTLILDTFESLIRADLDLRTGGIQLSRLSYDVLLELVGLLAKITEKQVVLILDAWEQSPLIEFEYKTLNAFLNHLQEWPSCHIFLGLRPDVDAWQKANQLTINSSAAGVYELSEMHLDNHPHRALLLELLRRHVPVTRNLKENELIELMKGFPGVLERCIGEVDDPAGCNEQRRRP
jgi:AAA+ ATPase superfamily predicted ATPase